MKNRILSLEIAILIEYKSGNLQNEVTLANVKLSKN